MKSLVKYIIVAFAALLCSNSTLFDCNDKQAEGYVIYVASTLDSAHNGYNLQQSPKDPLLAYCNINIQENSSYKSSKSSDHKGHKACEIRHIRRHNNFHTYPLQSPATHERAADKYVYAFRHIII